MTKARKSNYFLYTADLKAYARKNRRNMTRAEACLWKHALSRKQLGYSFKRQRPILDFIADFVCLELKLVIEVDGWTHNLDTVKEKDALKEKALLEAGFRVLRFDDDAVLNRMPDVIEEIVRVTQEIQSE